ncbi:MAG TPA: molecular chaperone DnaJ [Pseudomonadota bacterium]|nr:molecular chaperone DnaJ [Pseudomonadota bacterium]
MAETRRDFYEVLGLPKDADATEIKRAYRALALRYHPDQNQNDKHAEEKFKEVSAAYTVLSDPEKRARYDRMGHLGLTRDAAGIDPLVVDLEAMKALFSNLFGDLIGGKKGKGRDLRYTLDISLAEAAHGAQKTIRFPVRADCPDCQGTGARGGDAGRKTCATCAGKGEVKPGKGFFSFSRPCTVCQSTGKIVVDACAECRGAGLTEQVREYTVTIPAGTDDNTTRRISGQGEPGRRGSASGDLNVTVNILPHPILRREGPLLLADLPLTVTQAALGCSVDVPTLEGRVEMKIPHSTQSGTVFRLRGRGYPTQVGSTTRGDLHVKAVVETPHALTEAQRALLRHIDEKIPQNAYPRVSKFQEAVKELFGPADTTTTPIEKTRGNAGKKRDS